MFIGIQTILLENKVIGVLFEVTKQMGATPEGSLIGQRGMTGREQMGDATVCRIWGSLESCNQNSEM